MKLLRLMQLLFYPQMNNYDEIFPVYLNSFITLKPNFVQMKKSFLLGAIAMIGFALNANSQTVKQTEITSIDNSLSTVLKLTPVNFSYDKDWAAKLKLGTEKQAGFAIDEVAKVAPELVVNQQKTYSTGKNSIKTAAVPVVDYETLIPLLVGSIKEQQLQIEALKREVNMLRKSK